MAKTPGCYGIIDAFAGKWQPLRLHAGGLHPILSVAIDNLRLNAAGASGNPAPGLSRWSTPN
eukprot:7575344-Lingulodinium_polyedra.AAC.1